MPWPVRSTRLGLYVATPAANTQTYIGTVPTGKKWLVKEWTAYNAGASTRAIVLLLKTGGGTVAIWDQAATLASGIVTGNPYHHLVLDAGDQIGFQTTTAQALQLVISGAQLG